MVVRAVRRGALYSAGNSWSRVLNDLKQIAKRIPVVGPLLRSIHQKTLRRKDPPFSSEAYWQNRYEGGGNSGAGSYGRLAQFKAEILNTIVAENDVKSVAEYGCGDGNQLSLANYPKYLGFDVSERAVQMCRERFDGDGTKSFALVSENRGESADLTMSLDVIFHLVEDRVFEDYMHRFFDSAERFVIIYSLNKKEAPSDELGSHMIYRKFTDWVTQNKTEWELADVIPNRYPYVDDEENESLSDFFIFKKRV